MNLQAKYPTIEHQNAAGTIIDFFAPITEIETLCLICSCARGKASKDSCLDVLVLGRPEVMSTAHTELQKMWEEFYTKTPIFQRLAAVGKYAHVDLEFSDGQFVPTPRGWTGGPDEFELVIGNSLVYSVVLHQKSDYFHQLREKWLPYYDEVLRQKRLRMARAYCLNNLEHIQLYVPRGLHFQSFNRLYDAFREFLQSLFIAHRTYPIAYDKWIEEQIVDILGLSHLYTQLPYLFEVSNFEGTDILDKANLLRNLLDAYAPV